MTLWKLLYLCTGWQVLHVLSANEAIKTELVYMQIQTHNDEPFLLKAQRVNGHVEEDNDIDIPPTASLRRSLSLRPQPSTRAPIRTLRESNKFKQMFEMVTDVAFRTISLELSRRFWDTQFCNYPDKEITNTSADRYCLRCSCDDRCDRNMSCCSDIQSKTNTSYRYVRDDYTVCKHFENIKVSLMYEFVVKCPLTAAIEEEEEIKNRLKCEGHYNDTTLEDWEEIPVFDNTTHTNYMNIYCALCHGVVLEHLTFWTLVLTCFEQNQLTGSCIEYSKDYQPSNDAIKESTVCYADDEIIAQCNVTGLWEEYDEFTEDACQLLRTIYVVYKSVELSHQPKRYVYQNVFCAICNGLHISPQNNCSKTGKDMDDFTSGLSTLIVYKTPPAAISPDLTPHGYCPRKMKYDPLLGGCNMVHCSWPLLLDAETSCSGSMYVMDAVYTIPITVELDGPVTLADVTAMAQLITKDVRESAEPMVVNELQWFYKTNIDYSKFLSILDKTNLPFIEITDVYLVLQVLASSVKKGTTVDVNSQYQSFKQALGRRTTVVTGDVLNFSFTSNKTIVYTNTTTDPWFLRVSDNTFKVKMGVSYFRPLRDVYDDSIILKREPLFLNHYPLPLGKYRETYATSFLSCPAFTYNLSDHAFVRYPSGLLLKTANARFGFDVFKSINDSHVKICVESITRMSRNAAVAFGFRAPPNPILLLSVAVGLGVRGAFI